MKIIDEKGRLFGKINVIDFLVIFILFCLVPMFYFGYKILTKKTIVITPELEEVILKVKFTNLLPKITETVKDGDEQVEFREEMLESKKVVRRIVVAKIEKILSNEPAEYITLKEDRTTWGFAQHPKNRDLVLEIKVLCKQKDVLHKQKDSDLVSSKNVPLKIGLQFNFSTYLYSISGTIIEIIRK